MMLQRDTRTTSPSFGNCVLVGDLLHQHARKGLNLAVSDVFYLSRALTETYRTGKRITSIAIPTWRCVGCGPPHVCPGG